MIGTASDRATVRTTRAVADCSTNHSSADRIVVNSYINQSINLQPPVTCATAPQRTGKRGENNFLLNIATMRWEMCKFHQINQMQFLNLSWGCLEIGFYLAQGDKTCYILHFTFQQKTVIIGKFLPD